MSDTLRLEPMVLAVEVKFVKSDLQQHSDSQNSLSKSESNPHILSIHLYLSQLMRKA